MSVDLERMADLMAEAAKDDDLLLRVWFNKFKMSDGKKA
jgi:hypothetical protein